jgi:Tfp pilus assembly protein FimT
MKPVNHEGVTLIELVVVFVIIAIMAGLLVPNIGAWLPNYRLRSATRDVVSTMRTAQVKAVSTNLEYRVSFNTQSFWLERGDQSSGSTNWATEGAVQILPTGITISVGGNVQFNTNSTSSTASVTLTNTKGAQKKITITAATGRAKIE